MRLKNDLSKIIGTLVVFFRAFCHPMQVMRTSQISLPAHAAPSFEHISPNRVVSSRIVEWGEGRMLPLQKYRSIGARHRSWERNNTTSVDADTYLHQITVDPSSFQLSKTSTSLLESINSLSHSQKQNLAQKIQIELKATEDVPLEALEILYCDAHICVANKPSGVLSVPGPRRNPALSTLVYDTLRPPGVDLDQMVVHRLDMATSGVIVYALSLEALSRLHQDFKIRRVKKTYEALLVGSLGNIIEGEIDVDLERDPDNPPFMRIAQPKLDIEEVGDVPIGKIGKDHKFYKQAPKQSLTTWRILQRDRLPGQQAVTRVQLTPWTGRTHQLRVHCAQALGAPIVGDDIYGGQIPGMDIPLCLHARQLCIYHPISGAPMMFEADPPF